jgi:enamine deaminase RidA (YjgF/YER057c/UK114 family)
LYLSGSIGLDPKTGEFAGDGVQDQARQVDSCINPALLFIYILVIKKSR